VEKIIIVAGAAPPKATNLNIFIYLSSRICISHTHVCTYFRYIFKKFSKRHIRCSDFEIQQRQTVDSDVGSDRRANFCGGTRSYRLVPRRVSERPGHGPRNSYPWKSYRFEKQKYSIITSTSRARFTGTGKVSAVLGVLFGILFQENKPHATSSIRHAGLR